MDSRAPRAAVVVTGTEVLTGRVSDRNGPWLAEQLRLLGVDIAQIVVVGDRPEDLEAALAGCVRLGVALVITSGGLGPTADDLTAEVVARFQGRPAALDTDLEARIGAIVERLARGRGWRLDPAATAAAVRKQAFVPAGASVLEPVGTAPGLVVPPADGRDGPPVVVLPGPPRELQGMWPAAIGAEAVRAAVATRTQLRQETVRLCGTPESELAASLRDQDLDGLEVTTCMRGIELEIVTRYAPDHQPRYDRLVDALVAAFPDTVFSVDGSTVDDLVAAALVERGLTIATAESCTGGLLAARLTARPGSSDCVVGGVVVYSDALKRELLQVDADLITMHGAVSAEVAEAMADGAVSVLGADVGVGITGVAGPGGGSAEKPVGLVHVAVRHGERRLARRLSVPGTRADVRERSVGVALHLVRELLLGTSVTGTRGDAR